MKLIFKLIIIILSNTTALYVTSVLVPGFNIEANFIGFLKIGLVLGIVNTLIRPIVKILSFPLLIVTLGLFSLVINVLLLYLTSYLFDFFTINSFIAGVLGLFVISIINYILLKIFKS